MKQHTLDLIGRSHKPEDITSAFALASSYRFQSINADIIAGLPEENTEDFINTLEELIGLNPENITVHCLAVKRASKLKDIDKDFHYKQAEIVAEMLEASRKILGDAGYIPYYMYRQKHMAGAFENTGYCKKIKIAFTIYELWTNIRPLLHLVPVVSRRCIIRLKTAWRGWLT